MYDIYDIETFNDEMSAINSIKSEFVKMKTIESLNFHREVFRCSAIKQTWKFQCAAMVCLEYCQITDKILSRSNNLAHNHDEIMSDPSYSITGTNLFLFFTFYFYYIILYHLL